MAELVIRIKGDSVSVENALKKTNEKLEKTGKKVKKQNKSMGLSYAALGAAALAAAVVIGRAFVDIVKVASDAEETISKCGVVFQDVGRESEIVTNDLAKNFGLASVTAKELLGDTGDLLTGFGFTGKAALDMSKQVNELAVDLTSFTNFSGGAEGASKALTKALLGERESVKSLGISILETDVKAKVLMLRQQGMTFESDRQAKAFATLKIAQDQSKNAIGDYARTQQSTSNQMKLFGERVKDVKVSLGTLFLPTVQLVLIAVNDFLFKMKDVGKEITNVINSAAGIRTLASAIFLVKISIGSIVPFIKNTASIMIATIKIIIEAWMGLGSVIKAVFTGGVKEAAIDAMNKIKENGIIIAQGFKDNFTNMSETRTEFLDKWTKADEESKERSKKNNKKLVVDHKATMDGMAKETNKQQDAFIKMINANQKKLTDSYAFQLDASKALVNGFVDSFGSMELSWKTVLSSMVGAFVDLIVGKLAALAALEWAQVMIPITGPAHIPAAIALTAASATVKGIGTIAQSALAAPHGTDFTTDGQQTVTVGDNPSGRERVTVTPEEDIDSGEGGNTFIIENLTIVSDNPDQFGQQMKEFGILTAKRA